MDGASDPFGVVDESRALVLAADDDAELWSESDLDFLNRFHGNFFIDLNESQRQLLKGPLTIMRYD